MELFVSFSEIMHFFKRNRWRFLLVVLAFGIVCGLLPLRFLRPSYTANTSVTFSCEVPDNATADYHLQYGGILNTRVQTAVVEAASNNLLERTAGKLGIDKAEISKITGEQVNNAPVVKLTVQTPNADKAAQISDTAAQILSEQITREFPSPKLTASITDKAMVQKGQSRKSAMAKAGILGLILGFIVYVAYGILCVLSDHSVRNGRVAEETLHIRLLAEIPHESRGESKKDAYRKMRAAALHQFGSAKSFLVTSVTEQDSGEEAAAGLAASFAQAGRKVLLVDADLRDPKLAAFLNVRADKTLQNVLEGSCPLKEAAAEVPGMENLSLLAGARLESGSPADLFAKGFDGFAGAAAALYDYVIVYAPAETSYPDADSLAPFTPAVIVTAKYGFTGYGAMKEALRGLSAAGGKVAGFVVTDS
ncbi:MAG: hypothetical protein LKJ21_02415 [Oscillospiraceae bacterium]|jgi:Mrp family chromosome partitioning ATPase|nr:hypothetical protein [Oscillospiraceae bacterium]MCI2036105.1 hypothetical protein [Oscillospiraceae bacterium]